MNIDLKPRNKIAESLYKLVSKSEDALLSLTLFITNYWQPKFLMNWLDRYTIRRISQLQAEQVKNNWKTVGLQEAVKQIRSRQQN